MSVFAIYSHVTRDFQLKAISCIFGIFAACSALAQADGYPPLQSAVPAAGETEQVAHAPIHNRRTIGLVLSSDGARGVAHVGVLKDLESMLRGLTDGVPNSVAFDQLPIPFPAVARIFSLGDPGAVCGR